MDRRSFMMTLFGSMAVASLGGMAGAAAAEPKLIPPHPEPPEDEGKLAVKASEALDKADAEYSYYYRRRYYGYRRPYYRPRYYYRPRPRYYYRPRYYRPYYRRRYYY